MPNYKDIQKPTLLLDKDRAIGNIDEMVAKAAENRVNFRPHFKTHQSADIAEWFRERGVKSITVSSVDMAEYFADHGWKDITIAFPVNLRQISLINKLARTISLNLLVESVGTADFLNRNLNVSVGVWIKIDAGYHRTGILWDEADKVTALAERIVRAPNLNLIGILTHSGNTYGVSGEDNVREIYEESLARLRLVQDSLRQKGFNLAISIGDTPGCCLVENFEGVDEIRPGNFIFFDLHQYQIGSCTEKDIAVAVACPVVSKHEERLQVVVYGGAIHLSKEFIKGHNGEKIFGRIAHLENGGWSSIIQNSALISLSQEHGIIQGDLSFFDSVHVGDLVAVIPVHSCLTANLLGKYRLLDGDEIAMARF